VFLQIDQDSTVATSGEGLEQLLSEMLKAVRKHKRDDDESEVFHLVISSMEMGENAYSEVGIERFDAESNVKTRIYTAPID